MHAKTVRLFSLAAVALAQAALAQSPSPKPTPPPSALGGTPPPTVAGYVVTLELKATAPELKTSSQAAPEAQALMGQLRQQSQLKSVVYMTQDLSRQEILSTDFVLPAGTLVLHQAGAKYYVIADAKAQTYLVMDSEQLLNALEGGAGIVNSQYQAKVVHTEERKTIAGYACRKSIVTVTYVSAVPFENDKILVQQKNDMEVWHTAQLVSGAVLDHFFFKFQRDKTGAVQKALSTDIGFPMEVSFTVTQAGAKKQTVQPGSFHMLVSEVKIDKKLDSKLFEIPPSSYRKIEKNPYFKEGALSSAGARMAAEAAKQQ